MKNNDAQLSADDLTVRIDAASLGLPTLPCSEFLECILKIHGFKKADLLIAIARQQNYPVDNIKASLFWLKHHKRIKMSVLGYVWHPNDPHPLLTLLKWSMRDFVFKYFPHLVTMIFVLLTALILIAVTSLTAKTAEGWQLAEVTAYCPCSLCCGEFADGRTANNTRVDQVPYNFAADRSLPMGTKIFIPVGLGVLDRVRNDERWFSVDDRGGALDSEARRYGKLRLDLRVRDHWWAIKFGRRMIPVFIK